MFLWFTLQPFASRKIYHLASNHMFRGVCLLWFRCFSFYFFSLSQWRTWKLSFLYSCLLFLSQPLKHPNTAENQFLFSFNWSFGEKSQLKDANLLTNLLWPAQISSLPKKVLTLLVEWAFWFNYCSPLTQTHTHTHMPVRADTGVFEVTALSCSWCICEWLQGNSSDRRKQLLWSAASIFCSSESSKHIFMNATSQSEQLYWKQRTASLHPLLLIN